LREKIKIKLKPLRQLAFIKQLFWGCFVNFRKSVLPIFLFKIYKVIAVKKPTQQESSTISTLFWLPPRLTKNERMLGYSRHDCLGGE
jgi:hypothetical protein